METDESPPDSLILPPSVLAEFSPRTSSLLMHVVTPKKGDDNLNVVYTDLQKQMVSRFHISISISFLLFSLR